MKKEQFFYLALIVIGMVSESCRKEIDGMLRSGMQSDAVVGPGPAQPNPNPNLTNPLKFRSYVQLSKNRGSIAAIAAGSKIFFAGGLVDTGNGVVGLIGVTRVDIFDTATLVRTTAELSQGRWAIGATAVGNKVFFAGGYTAYEIGSKRIDIYDVSTNTWSIASLTDAKGNVAAAGNGEKVIFAGGRGETVPQFISPVIDIYNLKNKAWTTGSFAANSNPKAAAAGNIVAVAGFNNASGYSYARTLNTTTNLWASTDLYFDLNPSSMIATSAAGKLIFGASRTNSISNAQIRILNPSNMQWSQHSFTGPRRWQSSCGLGNYAFITNGLLTYPYSASDDIDIYNANIDKWYRPKLVQPGSVCAATGKMLMVRGPGTNVQVYDVKE